MFRNYMHLLVYWTGSERAVFGGSLVHHGNSLPTLGLAIENFNLKDALSMLVFASHGADLLGAFLGKLVALARLFLVT